MSELLTHHPQERDYFDPELDLTREDWQKIRLEHYLVTHTAEYAPKIADELNQSKPEIIFLENTGGTNEERREYRVLLQALADHTSEEFINEVNTKLIGANKDFGVQLASRLTFPVKINLVDMSEEEKGELREGYAEACSSLLEGKDFDSGYKLFLDEAETISKREQQVRSQLLFELGSQVVCTDSITDHIRAAVVTGAVHTGITRQLRGLGIDLSRKFISNRDIASRGEKLKFDEYSIALRTALNTNDKEKVKQAFQRAYASVHLQAMTSRPYRSEVSKKITNLSSEELNHLIGTIDSVLNDLDK